LLQSDYVVYAGVKVPHPLENELEVVVCTDRQAVDQDGTTQYTTPDYCLTQAAMEVEGVLQKV
ncbi:hypothetical protein KIPB_016499, partial [Kipferlia bialata]